MSAATDVEAPENYRRAEERLALLDDMDSALSRWLRANPQPLLPTRDEHDAWLGSYLAEHARLGRRFFALGWDVDDETAAIAWELADLLPGHLLGCPIRDYLTRIDAWLTACVAAARDCLAEVA